MCPGNEAHSGIQKSHVNVSHERAWNFYNWIYILLSGKQKHPAILYSVFNKMFERDQQGWPKRRHHPIKAGVIQNYLHKRCVRETGEVVYEPSDSAFTNINHSPDKAGYLFWEQFREGGDLSPSQTERANVNLLSKWVIKGVFEQRTPNHQHFAWLKLADSATDHNSKHYVNAGRC